jgi:hypothetical protein
MINDHDRDALITYWFKPTQETCDLSRFPIDSGKLIVT